MGCVQGGYTIYVCHCTDSYYGDETEALGHSFGPWSTVKEPTETEEGEANRTCSVCGDIDLDSMYFAYSDWEAANIMLGYINSVRSSAGLRELKLDNTLIEVAKIQAKDFRDGFISYKPVSATGWYVDGGNSIRHHYEKCSSSSYEFLTTTRYRYMGYGWYWPENETAGGMYGAILMWTQGQHDGYYGLDSADQPSEPQQIPYTVYILKLRWTDGETHLFRYYRYSDGTTLISAGAPREINPLLTENTPWVLELEQGRVRNTLTGQTVYLSVLGTDTGESLSPAVAMGGLG